MRDEDLPQFAQLLDATCALMTRGTYTPNDSSTDIFFAALEEYDIATVRAGFTAHVRSSRFSPTPADIREAIEGAAADDGRPGPEEGWALALTARNEADTVVWTPEVAQAWGVARVVYGEGDEVGARMAFKETYARLVAEARAARRPLRWDVAEGFDPGRKAEAMRIAAGRGRIPVLTEGQADTLQLPAPSRALAFLPAPEGYDPEAERRGAATAALAAIAARIVEAPVPVSAAFADRPRLEALRAETAAKTAEYAEGQPA